MQYVNASNTPPPYDLALAGHSDLNQPASTVSTVRRAVDLD